MDVDDDEDDDDDNNIDDGSRVSSENDAEVTIGSMVEPSSYRRSDI